MPELFAAFLEATPIVKFNMLVVGFFTVFFAYQAVFFVIGALKGEYRYPKARQNHRYAFFIAAHNEEQVIANLVRSIKAQDYPQELIDVFVVADSCTDCTAEVARSAGAIVYERNDLARKGKSWVMDYGFARILREYPGVYEGFFVFDADNLVSPDFTTIMNDAFDQGYMAVTGYRNSKNFGSSWISAAYATAYLREARFLNNARMICGTSCAVSGSGYLVSARIIEAMHGWQFHTLTEDIQFSTFCAIHGVRIAYAPAQFYDEQPVTFKASWKQRMRWTKGFYQVFFTYGAHLIKSMVRFRRFSAYDMFMTVAPGNLITAHLDTRERDLSHRWLVEPWFSCHRYRDRDMLRVDRHDARRAVPDVLLDGPFHDHPGAPQHPLHQALACRAQCPHVPAFHVHLYPAHRCRPLPQGRLGANPP